VSDQEQRDEERVATPEELERFLGIADKSVPNLKRTVIKLGEDDEGNPLGVIVWGKP